MLKLRVSQNDRDVADLFLSQKIHPRLSGHQPSVVCISSRHDAERRNVERFIEAQFAGQYGARIQVEYPVIMSVRDDAGVVRAAAGFRPAGVNRLFLERYLSEPIEAAICARGQPTARRRIVEVGNLASLGQGDTIFLFAALASYLDQQGFSFVTATGTKGLARKFRMIGIRTETLADANIQALGADAAAWGSYYDTEPRVMFGPIAPGVEQLRETFGARYELRTPRLLPRLHHRSTPDSALAEASAP